VSGKKNRQGTHLQLRPVHTTRPNEFYAGVLTKLVRPCFPILGSKTHFFKGGTTLKVGVQMNPLTWKKETFIYNIFFFKSTPTIKICTP